MKKLLLSIVFIVASFTSIAQVGIGTTAPGGALDVVSTTSGFVMPRVANSGAVVNPNGGPIENGTMVYDLSSNCVIFYSNGAWTGCILTAIPPVIYPTTQVPDGNGGFYTFMSHNLGADYSIDANIPDVGLIGGYVQWGYKGPDEWAGSPHDITTGFARAPTAADPYNGSIVDWARPTAVFTSWNVDEAAPVKTETDPCPSGFRVPTEIEWEAVVGSNTVTTTGTFVIGIADYNSAVHFGTALDPQLLTLPVGGSRSYSNGNLGGRGKWGRYWSSKRLTAANASHFVLGGATPDPDGSSSVKNGMSIRCIAE
jgi:uncharacterized protein (TIGR02145 family)